MSKQLDVAYKIVESLKEDRDVVAVNLFGSVAKGLERPDSDLDIEVVRDDVDDFSYETKVVDGVYVDLITLSRRFMLMRLRDYPYLNYGYLNRKSIYDPSAFMASVLDQAKSYFDTHPEVVAFWKSKEEYVKRMKQEGKKPDSAFSSYDEAEILFSKTHRVTRNFFRG